MSAPVAARFGIVVRTDGSCTIVQKDPRFNVHCNDLQTMLDSLDVAARGRIAFFEKNRQGGAQ